MHISPEALFLVQAILLIGLPFTFWRFRWVKLLVPLVVVQVVVGILLGPTVLGRAAPGIFHELFPTHALPALNGIASLGLCLLGLLTGLHFDFKSISNRGAAFVVTSLSSLFVPFTMGLGLAAVFFRPPYTTPNTNTALYLLGIATALAVTALPVLSAILIELKIINTSMGKRVLAYAAVNDIALWMVIAALTAIAHASASGAPIGTIVTTLILTILYVCIMVVAVRPLCRRLAANGQLTATPSSMQLAFVVTGLLTSCLATDLIGIHFMFGAFVFGAVMPKPISSGLYKAFEEFTLVILMPFYFMLTGLKMFITFSDSSTFIFFIAATGVAILGKVIGTALPEYLLYKLPIKEAMQSGVLMQTKGLMEIVVLNILFAAHIISGVVFSALVLTAIVSTLLTKPLLILLRGRGAATQAN